MRLIDVDTIELKTFAERNVPKYAILSHTWGPDEVTYQELSLITRMRSISKNYSSQLLSQNHDESSSGSVALMLTAMEMLLHGNRDVGAMLPDLSEEALMKRKGFAKIANSAKEAKRLGYQYIWCDTCCIDKTSSSELQESINTMYRWYEESDVCLVYLNDIEPCTSEMSMDDAKNAFAHSRWITRGWTLQELIAPSNVRFYFQDWTLMGDKIQFGEALSSATAIPTFVLENGDLNEVSLANRMSWGASRQTTRIEDTAYCLLGIFDIQMPLLYGEGEKAFIRLQEEILKTTDDYSLFAWQATARDEPSAKRDSCHRGLLARSPQEFKTCKTVERENTASAFPISSTPIGLRVQLEFIPHSKDTDLFLAFIRCTNNMNQRLAIHLRRLENTTNQYARVNPSSIFPIDDWPTGQLRTIYVRQRVSLPHDYYTPDLHIFHLQRRKAEYSTLRVRVLNAFPLTIWNHQKQQLLLPSDNSAIFLGVLFLQAQMSDKDPPTDFQVILGLDRNSRSYWCKAVVYKWPKLSINPQRFQAVIKKVLPQGFLSTSSTNPDAQHDIFIGGEDNELCVNINIRAGMHGDYAVLQVLIDGLENRR